MQIQTNISLKDKNWFKTGGYAEYYCEPENPRDFVEALEFAKSKNIVVNFLGEGANILVNDEGVKGLVIHPSNKDLTIQNNNRVTAGAGARVGDVINFCLDQNLAGLEEFSGIPGTVGGSVYINIHYFDKLLSDYLSEGRVIDTNTLEISTKPKEWFEFGYDTSKLISRSHFLIDATFQLSQIDELRSSYLKGKRDEMIRTRNNRYPTAFTCGSFFRNFHAQEVGFEINGNKILSVAYYLDKLGIKGELSVGGTKVSEKHANMIQGSSESRSSDIIALARKMQEMMKDEFGLVPIPECQLLGFEADPFLS